MVVALFLFIVVMTVCLMLLVSFGDVKLLSHNGSMYYFIFV